MRLFSFHPFSSGFPILKLKKDLEKKRRRNLLLARSDTYFIVNLLLYNESQILIIRENDFRCDIYITRTLFPVRCKSYFALLFLVISYQFDTLLFLIYMVPKLVYPNCTQYQITYTYVI